MEKNKNAAVESALNREVYKLNIVKLVTDITFTNDIDRIEEALKSLRRLLPTLKFEVNDVGATA